MHPKALRVLAEFTSSQKDKQHLRAIRVSREKLQASDGFVALEIEGDGAAGPAYARFVDRFGNGLVYPDHDKYPSKKLDKVFTMTKPPKATVKLDARYLERMAHALKLLTSKGLCQVTMSIYGEHDPILFTAETTPDMKKIRGLIMPIR